MDMSLLASSIGNDIWSSGAFSYESPLKDLLDSGNYTLEQLLREDELLQEVKGMDPQLIAFLSQVESCRQLLECLSSDEDDDLHGIKYPYMACEVICCEISGILDTIVDHVEGEKEEEVDSMASCDGSDVEEENGGRRCLLDLFFSLLEREELDDRLAGYFEKILTVLFQHRPATLQSYISSRGLPLLRHFFRHLSSHSITQILQRLLLPAHETTSFQSYWSTHPKEYVSILVEKLMVENVDITRNAAEILILIIRSDQSVTESLLKNGFLSTVVKVCDVTELLPFESQMTCILGIFEVLLFSAQNYVSLFSHSILENLLSSFQTLLTHPSTKSWTMENQSRKSQNILGYSRLVIVKCLNGLVLLNDPVIDSIMISHNLFNTVLDLFFAFEWSNFLQTNVTSILTNVLNGGTQRYSTQRHLVEECMLLERIMRAFDGESDFRKGYLGHLIVIAQTIDKNFAKASESDDHLETDKERKDSFQTALGENELVPDVDDNEIQISDDDNEIQISDAAVTDTADDTINNIDAPVESNKGETSDDSIPTKGADIAEESKADVPKCESEDTTSDNEEGITPNNGSTKSSDKTVVAHEPIKVEQDDLPISEGKEESSAVSDQCNYDIDLNDEVSSKEEGTAAQEDAKVSEWNDLSQDDNDKSPETSIDEHRPQDAEENPKSLPNNEEIPPKDVQNSVTSEEKEETTTPEVEQIQNEQTCTRPPVHKLIKSISPQWPTFIFDTLNPILQIQSTPLGNAPPPQDHHDELSVTETLSMTETDFDIAATMIGSLTTESLPFGSKIEYHHESAMNDFFYEKDGDDDDLPDNEDDAPDSDDTEPPVMNLFAGNFDSTPSPPNTMTTVESIVDRVERETQLVLEDGDDDNDDTAKWANFESEDLFGSPAGECCFDANFSNFDDGTGGMNGSMSKDGGTGADSDPFGGDIGRRLSIDEIF